MEVERDNALLRSSFLLAGTSVSPASPLSCLLFPMQPNHIQALMASTCNPQTAILPTTTTQFAGDENVTTTTGPTTMPLSTMPLSATAPPAILHSSPLHYVSPHYSSDSSSTVFMPYTSSSSHSRTNNNDTAASEYGKRSRDDVCTSFVSTFKKRVRENAYLAPRSSTKKSLVSAVGTLASTSTMHVGNNNNNNDMMPLSGLVSDKVHHRKQLSGSGIEGFLGGGGDHDAMEVDVEATRPRSMSF